MCRYVIHYAGIHKRVGMCYSAGVHGCVGMCYSAGVHECDGMCYSAVFMSVSACATVLCS